MEQDTRGGTAQKPREHLPNNAPLSLQATMTKHVLLTISNASSTFRRNARTKRPGSPVNHLPHNCRQERVQKRQRAAQLLAEPRCDTRAIIRLYHVVISLPTLDRQVIEDRPGGFADDLVGATRLCAA